MKLILEPAKQEEIKLNNDQQFLTHQLNEWLENKVPGSFLLDSLAGTGKTATVAHALKNRPLFLAAPTHRAVNEFVKRLPLCSNFSTVHSLLSAQPVINIETGALEFVTGEGKEVPDNAILVIDESGMLCKDHVNKLESVYTNYKRLYLGDSNQLPPVKESTSQVFRLKHQKVGTLTKIERYTGEILEYATAILKGRFEAPESLVSRQMARYWKQMLRAGLECKMLAYTNRAVDAWNLEARETINGTEAVYENDWIDNDPIILKAPIKSEEPNKPTRFHANEPGIIYNVRPDTYKLGKTEFPTYLASLHFPEMREHLHNVRLMSLNMEQGFQKWHKHIVDGVAEGTFEHPGKVWSKYYSALEDFAQIKHNYASTIHSTQGATIEHVFVDTKNIKICKNKTMHKQLLYTAITRAAQTLMVNG